MTISCLGDANLYSQNNPEVLDKNKNKLKVQKMGMDKNGEFHLQLYSSSPAPKRDYHGLTISSSEIILNSWDISRGTHVYPTRKRINLSSFMGDKWIRAEIQFLFGKHVITYIDRLVRKDRSIFCLSEKLVRKVIDYLAVKDILHLKQSSKIFFELCNTNDIWKILFRKIQKRPPNPDEMKQAELGLTWSHILQSRVHDIRERKTIYQNYKKGIEALHRRNHEIGDKIRNIVKKGAHEKWRRMPPDAESEKLLENKIKISTYVEKNPNDETEKVNPIIKVPTQTKVINTTQLPLSKKRIESKKNIETINEMKKTTLSQKFLEKQKTVKLSNIKGVEKRSNCTKSMKIVKNTENIKSKSYVL